MFCDLTRCFLCTHCLPEWKEVIALHKETRPIKKGQDVFKEGDPVTGIFFMYSGAVKVHQAWGEKELILSFAAPGDVLGHRGLGSAGVHPVSATALENSTVCFISQPFLENSFRANPGFLYETMQLYARALARAENRMRLLALTDTRGRVAEALQTLRSVYGVNDEGFIRVGVTRHDIAAYAGTTYETVFKLFTEWTAAGQIVTRGKYIKVLL